jgi:hypothetical protein
MMDFGKKRLLYHEEYLGDGKDARDVLNIV